MEKDNIISQLYTLRAGISVISQEKKKIDSSLAKNEKNRVTQTQNLQHSQNAEEARLNIAIDNAKKDYSEKKDMYDKRRGTYEKTREIAECSLSYAQKKDFFGRLKKSFGIILGILTTLLGVGLLVYGIMAPIWFFGGLKENNVDNVFLNSLFGWINDRTGPIAMWGGFIGGIGFIILAIVGWVSRFFTDKFDAYTSRANDIRSARKRLDVEKRAMNIAKQKMNEAQTCVMRQESKLREVQKNAEEQAAELERSLTTGKVALTEYLKPRFQASIALFNGLETTFGKLLDVRDWGNLDYVIYSLETGRADSVKEALQLADREEQTNRIVQAVAMASAAICRSITTGLTRLQNDMRLCFTTLANEMARQNAVIMEGVSAVSAQVAGVSAQVANVSQGMAGLSGAIAELSSASRLSNSLLEESSQTSSKLADDVHKLRYYADYAQMRS